MNRFIVSTLCVSVFFIGLAALVDKAGARIKSDEKALELIRQAKLAIGGEQAIAGVRSLTIKGKTSVTFKTKEGDRTEQGETEIALQLPNNFMKMTKLGVDEGVVGEKVIREQHDVLIVRKSDDTGESAAAEGKKVIAGKMENADEIAKIAGENKEGEFTTTDGKKVIIRHVEGGEVSGEKQIVIHKDIEGEAAKTAGGNAVFERKAKAHEEMRLNELARTTLSLLLTAPEGLDVNYTFAGESDVDGTPVNVVNAEFAGSSFKFYLSKASSLPVMISFIAPKMPQFFHIRTKAPEGAEAKKDTVFFKKFEGGPMTGTAEYNVRFSDYRGVNGVQLPFRWTTSVSGQTTEVFDVTAYDLNPANIGEKFSKEKVLVRTKKPVGQ
jgi:hypothetical protein